MLNAQSGCTGSNVVVVGVVRIPPALYRPACGTGYHNLVGKPGWESSGLCVDM